MALYDTETHAEDDVGGTTVSVALGPRDVESILTLVTPAAVAWPKVEASTPTSAGDSGARMNTTEIAAEKLVASASAIVVIAECGSGSVGDRHGDCIVSGSCSCGGGKGGGGSDGMVVVVCSLQWRLWWWQCLLISDDCSSDAESDNGDGDGSPGVCGAGVQSGA